MPPSKPVAHVPTSATIGSKAVLRCTEMDGSPPPTFRWYKDSMLMPADPKTSLTFRNSSYTLDPATGELVSAGGAPSLETPTPPPPMPCSHLSAPTQIFEPLRGFDSGDYSCEATNNVGAPQKSDVIHMEASKGRQPVPRVPPHLSAGLFRALPGAVSSPGRVLGGGGAMPSPLRPSGFKDVN